MAMTEALQKVALRKTVASATVAANLGEGIAMEKDRNARLRACDLNAWYDRLASATFRTRFVALSLEEAQALIDLFWLQRRNTVLANAERNAKLIAALQRRISIALTELAVSSSCKSFFAKLSSRSAKDSRFCEARAFEKVKQRLMAQRDAGKPIDTNAVLTACLACGIQALELSSAAEVIECFVTSDRVCEDDLPLALQFPATWSQFVVLREWVPIECQHEFRGLGYVINHHLTGLSQYFSGAYYPDLVANKERILVLVQRFFEQQVKNAVNLVSGDYVVDFALNDALDRAYVIEINPFGPPDGFGTGTPLFNLRTALDRAILFGEAPFEFRIETAAPLATAMAGLLRDGPLKVWLTEQRMLPAKV